MIVTGTEEESIQLSGAHKYSNSDNENVQSFSSSASPDEVEGTYTNLYLCSVGSLLFCYTFTMETLIF